MKCTLYPGMTTFRETETLLAQPTSLLKRKRISYIALIFFLIMAQKIIEVKNLVKNYGNFKAVKGINFDVYEGEIFGLLGPNGAGKSTTLEIIETLRTKTSGDVMVAGIDLDKQPGE